MVDLKKMVFEAMDNAIENGQFDLIVKGGVETVVIDLIDYDADIAEARPAVMDLIPHIEAWRAEHCDVCALPLSPQADDGHHGG